jgi:hypothetical protein
MYSKNGSIPKPDTDGTEGWIEVPDEPVCPEGKEVVWWYPPGWIIRDPKPVGNWSWSQSTEQWVEYIPLQEVVLTTDSLPAITSAEFPALTSSDLQAL